MANVLLLSDNNASLTFGEILEQQAHSVIRLSSLESALEVLQDLSIGGPGKQIDIAFIALESQLALDALRSIKSIDKLAAIPLVVLAQNDNTDIIQVMRLGALDYLTKPSSSQVKTVIDRALASANQSIYRLATEQLIFGQSPEMRQVQKLIGLAASCDATVLILGETGSGKDQVAREIHKYSRHSSTPLTVIDCTAVPEDYQSFRALKEGSIGTVILDEIGDLNGQTQALLVRALKEANSVRIIATTQYDLTEMVKEKRFREDLYYRLNVLPINLPPLNKRGSDILVLAEIFLQQAATPPKRLASSVAKILLDKPWPGNVRELQNLMYHLSYTVRSDTIELQDLNLESDFSETTEQKDKNTDSLDYYSTMAAVEKRLLTEALEKAGGSRSEAARLLGINRQLLYNKLKAHGLMKP